MLAPVIAYVILDVILNMSSDHLQNLMTGIMHAFESKSYIFKLKGICTVVTREYVHYFY